MELCIQELQNVHLNFFWHRYLRESKQEIGVKYTVFVDACAAGPITTVNPALPVGFTEFDDEEKLVVSQIQDSLLALRRKIVSFVSLPSFGGSSGADFGKQQLKKML